MEFTWSSIVKEDYCGYQYKVLHIGQRYWNKILQIAWVSQTKTQSCADNVITHPVPSNFQELTGAVASQLLKHQD